MRKQSGAGLQNYIIAARTAQGIEDASRAGEGERQDIVARWKALQPEVDRERWQWFKQSFKSSPAAPSPVVTTPSSQSAQSKSSELSATDLSQGKRLQGEKMQGQLNREYEEAVRNSVAATSQGNAEEDAAVEQAIRASLSELLQHSAEEDDPNRAESVGASISRIDSQQKGQSSRAPDLTAEGRPTSAQDDPEVASDDDENIKRAIMDSKRAVRQQGLTEDEELSRVLEESRRAHEDSEQQAKAQEEAVIAYMKQQSLEDSGRG